MSHNLKDDHDPENPFGLVCERWLSSRWNKSPRTLQRWRRNRCGPAWIRIGGTPFYRIGDILDFESRMRRDGGGTLMNTRAHKPDMPAIDPDAIRIWCGVVFGYLDGLVPIRFLAEKGTPSQNPSTPFVPVADVVERLVTTAPGAAEAQRAVYVVPGTVAKAGSARAEDIVQTGVLLVDLDEGDIAAKRDHLVRHLGTPSMEVVSGGITDEGHDKLHLYWRLSEAAETEQLSYVAALRAEIASKTGGDMSFGSLHQPVRVAGTIHGKAGIRSSVRLKAHSAAEYELTDLADAIAAMPAMSCLPLRIDTGRSASVGPSASDLMTRPTRSEGKDGITRFEAISKTAGHWIWLARQGHVSLEGAFEGLSNYNTAMIQPPWDEEALRREFEALLRKDIVEKGPLPARVSSTAGEPPDGEPSVVPEQSDDALADTFVMAEGEVWRHVPVWRAWFHWDGGVWRRDDTQLVRQRMRLICRAVAGEAKPHEARRIASEKTLTASLKLAASDPRVATTHIAWDAHPMLLNTRSGILDLETGEERPHDPSLMMTQITSASVGSGCPRWLAFLDEVTGGDRELVGYLQRLAGYCLTGRTSEQVFVFLHGEGANGKSVFLGTLAHVLGSYAATATLDTFAASRSSRHLTELAGLRAARLVLVPETEGGQAWAEARIKTVTGGESIRANFMHQDHFEFRPQFKLLVAGNHRPTVSNVGEAMRRRLHLVPFTVTIPPELRDSKLAEALQAEADGILSWMVEGCAAWLTTGLAPPVCVLEAAEDYFAAEDLVGQWIAECCSVGPQFRELSANLFQSWKLWADQQGFCYGTSKSLGEALRARGFQDTRVNRGRGWAGLALVRGPQTGEVSP
ncbi:phage/plasmid primase, P4 family [Tabrizicola sp.]|uniref:phage/plasmid primase, P4 family n=1 Tax=Tabrizicola sp. TaxID=2005166 RepID=UPI0035ADE63A